ncbi:MAG: acireductone synthase [Gammaproteobacteria bacterium]|nr:acireductone synthase [Gammaproteobacteria bacterium]
MIQAIVTDIEGTTSSLSFVKDVLFPYARQHLAGFVRAHLRQPAVAPLLKEVRQIVGQPNAPLEEVIQHCTAWIDQDKKITPLKALQGLIWEAGYRDKQFYGHVYPDAVAQLRAWRQRGIDLYVYSSGSIQAQKLLFAHTEYGDLTVLFKGYFDTTIGAKGDSASYQKIVQAIGMAAPQILFLSDSVAELDAARQAGLQTYWLIRAGEIPARAAHPCARDFSQITIML